LYLGLEFGVSLRFNFFSQTQYSERVFIKVIILNRIFVKTVLFSKYFFNMCYFVNILVNCASFQKNPQKFFKGKLNLVGSHHQGNIPCVCVCVCVCVRERERESERPDDHDEQQNFPSSTCRTLSPRNQDPALTSSCA
jgi:hypothetical protein